MYQKEFKVRNNLGLHAKPSVYLSRKAIQFDSDIILENKSFERKANAKKTYEVMLLGAGPGCKVRIIAKGSDEKEAVEAIGKLIESSFYALPDWEELHIRKKEQ